jgi:hypothetical protein
MLFERRFLPGIVDGSITRTYRRWKRSQAVVGHRYRVNGNMIEVDVVQVVDPADIRDIDARRAGYPTAADLVADLRGTADMSLYCVQFHPAGSDPRDALAADDRLSDTDLGEIERRLARLDAASPHGPWTAAVLDVIGRRPGVRAGDLAAAFGRELQPFKLDVRKLKALGLTLSLEVGYELSPRGRAYLRRRAGG